jgi:peptide/nickel transport system permease protein
MLRVASSRLRSKLISVCTTLFGISIFVFVVLRVIPGDAITSSFGQDTSNLTPQTIKALKSYYGIDKPLLLQYFNWLKGFLTGNLGFAFHTGTPVTTLTASSFPVTLELALFASIIGVTVGTLMGIYSASQPGGRRDFFGQIFGLFALAVPSFVLSTLIVAVSANKFRYFPNGFEYAKPWQNLSLNLQQMMYPSIVLGIAVAAPVMRTARSSFIETQEKDFVRTAIGKGVDERRVRFVHVLRNSLNPIVTMTGIQFGYLLGGAVIVEQIFSLPGMGRQILDGIMKREYATVQSSVMIVAISFVFINLLTDLIYRKVDPRIRQNED